MKWKPVLVTSNATSQRNQTFCVISMLHKTTYKSYSATFYCVLCVPTVPTLLTCNMLWKGKKTQTIHQRSNFALINQKVQSVVPTVYKTTTITFSETSTIIFTLATSLQSFKSAFVTPGGFRPQYLLPAHFSASRLTEFFYTGSANLHSEDSFHPKYLCWYNIYIYI